MAKVSASIGTEPYKTEITSPTGNTVIADEPVESGGKKLGFSPSELLAASLSACTSATLRMYADRKGWDLKAVSLEVEVERDEEANKTFIHRSLELTGNLDEAQRSRLLAIANKCPIHKILSNPIEIVTELAQ